MTLGDNTPNALAAQLDVTGLQVRSFLRATYPRDPSEKHARWILDVEQVAAVRAYFGDRALRRRAMATGSNNTTA